ncbi:MAG: hypothetical protein A2000_05170 [Ignavibacteria bacterium GWB2_36_8]|nr:MAG: hypothetical protein A2000_05170 [Ignavibacteria bacterium GWB2_36_8]OGU49663.1 MAG: hypothetical protein A2080_06215 [Ignavibacteria bacterium GWC2_36_12]
METSNIYTLYAIIGGLIGSVLTVIISKVLDIIQQSREHRYSIQKTFFTKKLEVAEAAVSQWYVSSNVLGSIARLYEQAPVLEKGIERDVFNIMNNSLTIQLNKLQEASNQIANSFLLYFDIDDSFWNNEALNNFLKCLSNLKVIITSLDMFHNLNSGIPENDYKKLIQKEIDRLNKELEKEMKNFVSFIDDSREGMITLLKKVRNEMKKYE